MLFVAVFLGCTSTGRLGLGFLWFYVQELPKAQPAVVLVLKRLRIRDNGLKSHPTDYTFFVAVFLSCTSTGRVGLCFLWFYVQELPKAQPAVVLVLKRLRRRGNGLKSHPTDWKKPGIEPATAGLQDIGLSPTPRRLLYMEGYNESTEPIYIYKIMYRLVIKINGFKNIPEISSE